MFDSERKKILVNDVGSRRPRRMIDLRYVKDRVHFRVSLDAGEMLLSVRVQNEIDLVSGYTHSQIPTLDYGVFTTFVNCG